MFKRKIKTLLLTLIEKRLKKLKKSSKPTSEIHYLMTFPNNDQGFIATLIEEFGASSVKIGYQYSCKKEAEEWANHGVKIYSLDYTPAFFIKSLKELMKAKILIVDNYIAFLGKFRIYSEAIFFQIWHANGAIKTFGWEDHQTHLRGKEEQRRFQEVYDAIDYYVVGSDKMAEVFQASYRIPEKKILKTGLPRTDYFFDKAEKKYQKERFHSLFPEAVNRTVILYSPTYRNDEQNSRETWILSDDYVLFEKKHPHQTMYKLDNTYVIRDFKGMTLPELLFSVDILVTDYSSIPFEYVLACPQGRIYLYWYDRKEYQQHTGLQEESYQAYEEIIVETKQDLMNCIALNEQTEHLSLKEWNTYNDGRATYRLIERMRDIIDKGE